MAQSLHWATENKGIMKKIVLAILLATGTAVGANAQDYNTVTTPADSTQVKCDQAAEKVGAALGKAASKTKDAAVAVKDVFSKGFKKAKETFQQEQEKNK